MAQMCMHNICLAVYMCGAYEANVFNKCTSLLQQRICYMHTSPYVLHTYVQYFAYEVNTFHYIHNSCTTVLHMCKCVFSSSG